jgi:hypothetical protein
MSIILGFFACLLAVDCCLADIAYRRRLSEAERSGAEDGTEGAEVIGPQHGKRTLRAMFLLSLVVSFFAFRFLLFGVTM